MKVEAGMQTIAEIIREARQLAGMTQQELADKIPCLDQPTVSKYESGRQVPSAEFICWLADATGVTITFTPISDVEPQGDGWVLL